MSLATEQQRKRVFDLTKVPPSNTVYPARRIVALPLTSATVRATATALYERILENSSTEGYIVLLVWLLFTRPPRTVEESRSLAHVCSAVHTMLKGPPNISGHDTAARTAIAMQALAGQFSRAVLRTAGDLLTDMWRSLSKRLAELKFPEVEELRYLCALWADLRAVALVDENSFSRVVHRCRQYFERLGGGFLPVPRHRLSRDWITRNGLLMMAIYAVDLLCRASTADGTCSEATLHLWAQFLQHDLEEVAFATTSELATKWTRLAAFICIPDAIELQSLRTFAQAMLNTGVRARQAHGNQSMSWETYSPEGWEPASQIENICEELSASRDAQNEISRTPLKESIGP